MKGTRQMGKIIHIEKDVNKINWQGTKAYFIIVMFEDGEQRMAAPFQLKRVGKR